MSGKYYKMIVSDSSYTSFQNVFKIICFDEKNKAIIFYYPRVLRENNVRVNVSS